LSGVPQRLLITGASGCIGHYIVEMLLASTQHDLFLLMRNPAKLKLDISPTHRQRIHILEGDLRSIDQFTDTLGTIDTAILAATAWGDPQESFDINVTATLKLLSLLDPDRCQQVIYFSTASILDQQNAPLKAAGDIGTDYIRTKYLCHEQLPTLAISPKITTVFPTLVFGGAPDKPYSHISAGLPEVARWMWLVRFLSADGSLHFIHAKDIAGVVCHLVEQPPAPGESRELVIGNPAMSADQVIAEASQYLGHRLFWRVPLSFQLADIIIKVFKFKMAEWDRFCMEYRHFTYQNPVTPATFGHENYCPTLSSVLAEVGIPAKSAPAKST
jgi:nucleoside-diphosphate-sugar epimerase